jgi:hypothetical protein
MLGLIEFPQKILQRQSLAQSARGHFTTIRGWIRASL